MPEIGKLRHRLTFLQAGPNQQANGEDLQTWTPAFTVWGSIEQLRGQMLALAQADTATATATHQIVIRYNPDVTQTMRIQYGASYEDFDSLASTDYAALTSLQYAAMMEDYGFDPVIYTINSLLDLDTTRRFYTILATVVRA